MIYILTVRPMLERRAMRDLLDAKISAYAPSLTRWRYFHRRREGDNEPIEEAKSRAPHSQAVVTGYLFLWSDSFPEDWVRIRASRAGPYISGFLERNGEPVTIGEDWIARLLIAQSFGAFDHTRDRKPKMTVGQMVRIIGGQFQGVLAQITRIDGRKVVVEVPKGGLFAGPNEIDMDKLKAA